MNTEYHKSIQNHSLLLHKASQKDFRRQGALAPGVFFTTPDKGCTRGLLNTSLLNQYDDWLEHAYKDYAETERRIAEKHEIYTTELATLKNPKFEK